MKKTAVQLAKALTLLESQNVAINTPLADEFLQTQLATLVDEVPTAGKWIFETKFDGYRILGINDGAKIMLGSRNGLDWTHRFPNVVTWLNKLELDSFVLDGEVVVLGKRNRTSFTALQEALTADSRNAFTYFVFDVLYLNGYDVRKVPLVGRKKLLEHALGPFSKRKKNAIRLSEYRHGNGERAFKKACKNQLEGIIAKDMTLPYRGLRSTAWLKIKCVLEDEFVIAGYTEPDGDREYFGSLLLGYYDKSRKQLHYAGRVGTGFNQKTLKYIFDLLSKHRRDSTPFVDPLTTLQKKGVHYTDPKFVAQIAYTEWTRDGRLRHPAFLGLRDDKDAKDVTRNEMRSI